MSGEALKEETPVPVTATMDGRGNSGANAQRYAFDLLVPKAQYPVRREHIADVGKMVGRAAVCYHGKGLGYEWRDQHPMHSRSRNPMNATDQEFLAMSPHETTVSLRRIQGMIFTMRGLPVMIDRDLADVYGVENKRLNEQVKRNIERFPDTFRFQLTDAERDELVADCDRFAPLKHATSNPYALTEQGVSMEKSQITFESETAETSAHFAESARLEQEIRNNLKGLGYEW